MQALSQITEPPKRWKGLSHVQIDKKEAVSGFRWSLFYNLINKFVIPLANTAIVARKLGPGIIGPFGLLYAIYSASDVLRDFGLSQTYMRDHDMTPRKEGAYMTLGILQGLIPAALLFAFREQFAAFYNTPQLAPLMIWICLGLLVNGFWTIPKAKVLKAGRVKESGFREVFGNVVQIVVSVVMVLQGYTYEALVIPLFLNCVLNVVITYGLAPVTNFRTDLKTMGKTLRGASSTLGASVLYNIYIQADKFVIGRLASPTDVGLYGQAQGLAQKPMQLLSVPMMTPLQSAFSQNSKNPEKIGSIYARALAAAVLFIIPLYAVAIVAAKPIVDVILGDKWVASIPLVQICTVFFAARTVGTIGGTALVAGGKARFAMTSWIFCYATAVIGCYIASRSGSVQGFAWAFSLGAVAVYTVHTAFAFRWYPPDEGSRARLRLIAFGTLLTCLVLLGVYFLPLNSWIKLILVCLTAPLAQLGIIGWLLDGNPAEYMSMRGVKALYRSL